MMPWSTGNFDIAGLYATKHLRLVNAANTRSGCPYRH
jgi:hypothetical protein